MVRTKRLAASTAAVMAAAVAVAVAVVCIEVEGKRNDVLLCKHRHIKKKKVKQTTWRRDRTRK